MTKWFNEVVLETAHVKLLPIRAEHSTELLRAAADGDLSDLWFTLVPDATNVGAYIQKAIADLEADKGLAFVVVDKATGAIVGSTRYTNATPEHRRLEIGYTWYARSYQGTHVNPECKLLLLKHAFEHLQAVAVEFRTHWFNFTSRNAIAKLGAKQDGVLRNHQLLPDGSLRDTVVFSIIASEWKACERSLLFTIEKRHERSRA